MLKIPFQFFLKPSKFCSFIKTISLKEKERHVLADTSILTKIAVSVTLPVCPFCWLIFSSWFFELLKIPFQFFWNIQNFVLSSKHSVWRKKSMFLRTFQFSTKIAVSGPNRRGSFCLGDFFELIFWNVENTLPILPETFKILIIHENNQFEEKERHVLADTSILTKIAVSGPYRCGHFVGWFFRVDFLKCLKYPSNSSEIFKILFFHENNQFEEKKGMFWGLFNLDQNRCIRTLPAWPFCWLIFLSWSFEVLKIPFQFLWNIQNFVLSWKQSVWSKKRHVLGTFQFGPKSLYPELTGVAIFWLILSIFWNVENTLPILLKHSKFCSFMKTIILKKKKACFGDCSSWTKIVVSGPYRRGHFVGSFFWVDFLKCWKYPSNSSETFNILFFHENNQFEEKEGMFWGLFNLDQNRCILTLLVWPFFGWFWVFFEMLKIPFQFFWNDSKFCSWKQSVWRKKRHIFGKLQFWPKSLCPCLTGVPILGWFWVFFELLKIPFQFFMKQSNSVWRKKSMFLGLFNSDQNRCIWTLPAWPFLWLIFWVDFLKCWKYPSNFSETFKILFFHENYQFEGKTGMFWGLFNLDQNRCIRT